mgnify:CR=1 FL=1
MCYWKLLIMTSYRRLERVSILLILDVLLEEGSESEPRSVRFLVSILLILDVLLEVAVCAHLVSHRRRFNPSYTGCATGSQPMFRYRVNY